MAWQNLIGTSFCSCKYAWFPNGGIHLRRPITCLMGHQDTFHVTQHHGKSRKQSQLLVKASGGIATSNIHFGLNVMREVTMRRPEWPNVQSVANVLTLDGRRQCVLSAYDMIFGQLHVASACGALFCFAGFIPDCASSKITTCRRQVAFVFA